MMDRSFCYRLVPRFDFLDLDLDLGLEIDPKTDCHDLEKAGIDFVRDLDMT